MAPDQGSTPAQIDGLAFTRLCGRPLFKLPQGLYIPPDTLGTFLEAFKGPLDLLLYLIRHQNFDVLDVPLAQVTQQYLAYIKQIRTTNLGLAAEYLLIAVMLIGIKPRMLPPVKKTDSGDKSGDPRAELVRRPLEYEQAKLAVQKLDTMPQLGRDFLRAQIYIEQSLAPHYSDVNSDGLRVAWAGVLHRIKLTQRHKISHEELSVHEHMSQILYRLQHARFMEFTELFKEAIQSDKGAPIVVVSFVAIFELSRESPPEITQTEPYAPTYVRLTYSPT